MGYFTLTSPRERRILHNTWVDDGIDRYIRNTFDPGAWPLAVNTGVFVVPILSSTFHNSITESMDASGATDANANYYFDNGWATASTVVVTDNWDTNQYRIRFRNGGTGIGNSSGSTFVYGCALGVWSYANPGMQPDPIELIAISAAGSATWFEDSDPIDASYTLDLYDT